MICVEWVNTKKDLVQLMVTPVPIFPFELPSLRQATMICEIIVMISAGVEWSKSGKHLMYHVC
jgi:hypothetical protein